MDTEFEKKIVDTLELISITANQAWWEHHGEHCGSNFDLATCEPCFAFDQCRRNEKLVVLFKELTAAVA